MGGCALELESFQTSGFKREVNRPRAAQARLQRFLKKHVSPPSAEKQPFKRGAWNYRPNSERSGFRGRELSSTDHQSLALERELTH